VLRERTEIRFVIVGAACAGLYFLLLWALLSTPLGPALSGALAYGAAFVVAYRLQHGWTFRGGAPHRRALPRYAALQCTCALLSSVLATLLLRYGLNDLLAAALATVGLSAFSFVMSRYWVFQHG
jgi:putative flippase GtrA